MQDLPLQIAEIDHVEIDEADAADAGGREIQAQRRAETAGADEQHARGLEALLPVHADLGHDQVPAVAGDLLLRKRGGRGIGNRLHGNHS